MPPVMFSVVTKYHKGRHSLFLYNSEIFYAFTQDILRSRFDLYLVFENAVTAANFVNRHKRLGNLTISFDDSIITNFTALYTNPTIDHPDFEKRTVHLTFIKRLK